MTADITQVEWQVADVAESSALGAAFAAMLQLGIHQSKDDLTSLSCGQDYYGPQISAEHADHLQSGWQAAVQRVL